MKRSRFNLPSRSRRAFTLIEILVALGIFTMIIAAIYATWSALLKGSRLGLEVAAQVQRERIAMRTMERALGSARSFTVNVQHYGFVADNGNDAMLSFVAMLPEGFPRGGRFPRQDMRRVSFSLENGEDSRWQLVLRQAPLMMEFDRDEVEHPLILAKNVKELAFEFWDNRRRDWTDTWTETNQLPKLVRITLQMVPPNQKNTFADVESTTRIVSLPSIAVPVRWQRPNAGGQQPVPGTPPPNQPPVTRP